MKNKEGGSGSVGEQVEVQEVVEEVVREKEVEVQEEVEEVMGEYGRCLQ